MKDASTSKTPVSRPPKRRRSALLNVPRKTRKPGESVGSDKRKTSSIQPRAVTALRDNGKGKQREISGRHTSESPSENLADHSSSSGASSAARLLRPGSRDISRASSVVSTSASENSSVAISTPVKQALPPLPPRPMIPAPPLFHTHSHTRAINSTLQQLTRHVQRAPSYRPSAGAPATPGPTPGPSGSGAERGPASEPGPSHRRHIASNSPVTRSNCRYHKVTLPREEDGPRVCFLVPGCSLVDRELMEEEEIEDHGDATTEDSEHAKSDIDSLDFDAYLIGTLRQLVGVDMLREQDIFYLPQPGDGVSKKKARRRRSEKSVVSRLSSRDFGAETGNVFDSPRTNGSARSPTSPRAPPSVAGSTSTTMSAIQRVKNTEKDSASTFSRTDSEYSDGEDDSPTKKVKLDTSNANGNGEENTASSSKSTQEQAVKGKKSGLKKHLSKDHSAYAPAPEEEDEPSDPEADTSRSRRKKQGGVKRTRTVENAEGAEDADDRKAKKLKSNGSENRKSIRVIK